jgi:regulator of RNase E activity RraA
MKTAQPSGSLLQREAMMMKLEKLIAERESISTKPFPVPVAELLARYEKLYTGAVSDVLREFGLLNQSLPGRIKALREHKTVAGIAFTVKSAPNVKITGEMTFRAQMLSELPRDSFIAWDTTNDEKAALWGGVMTATAVGLGVRAAVIDGGIRDTHEILERDFAIFYKCRNPNGSLARCLITHYQIPIKIGDCVIKPGDVLLGDIDGVVCAPRDLACDVLVRAEQVRKNEKRIFQWVAHGQSIHQITAKGGYF